ncbi:MAG: RNA 2',3'-cyclic phosphodiesterase [Firmicutes bacterium]|nr:RNA 2',3'-cyclic phosphodiesterase [Bacillota bacterium]
MRLFVAINFSSRFKTALTQLTEELAAQAVFCRTTPPENFHLTLAFIGESERAVEAEELLSPALGPAFTLKTGSLGRFERQGGDVCWLGIRREPRLLGLQAEIEGRLRKAGFELERRPFRPHMTLLRQAAFPPGFDLKAWGRELPVLHERVTRVSLMRSDLSGPRPVYSELYGRELDV